jgi:hypothetical protein
MAQNYDPDCFEATHVAQSDLQKMKDNFECLRTTFAGIAVPPLAEGLLWLDTATNILRVQKAGVGGWLGILTGDTNQKIWVYRNDTLPGWVVDASVIDHLLALRGGLYGAAGGVTVGTWTQPAHQHPFTVDNAWVDHDHGFSINTGAFTHTHTVTIPTFAVQAGAGAAALPGIYPTSLWASPAYNDDTDSWMPAADYNGNTEDGATTPNWRPAAAVGTMQYINVAP